MAPTPSISEIERLVQHGAEQEPPVWLAEQIMAEVRIRPRGFAGRFSPWFIRPRQLAISPFGLFATTVVAVVAFWGGTVFSPSPVGAPDALQKALLPETKANAQASFLFGKGFLLAGENEQALMYLRQAEQQAPNQAEFAYWQGIAHWLTGETELERQSYLRALSRQPQYLPSLLSLGHSYLENGDYQQALEMYDRALSEDPKQPDALYNRALVYAILPDSEQARQAFSRYLEHYSGGKWAERALEHLHRLGDFTYRGFTVGRNRLILNNLVLLGPESDARSAALRRIAAAVSGLNEQELHLVVFKEGDGSGAREIARAIKADLLALVDSTGPPIHASWFGEADPSLRQSSDGGDYSASLLLFTQKISFSNRRNSI